MRFLVPFMPAFLVLSLPAFVSAQPEKKFLTPKIEKLHVGFQVHRDEMETTAYKVGLWTPIYIEVFGGTDGIAPNPDRPPHLQIETTDSDDVGTRSVIPVVVEPMQTRLFMGYVKTGHMSRNMNEITVTLHVDRKKLSPRTVEQSSTVNIDAHLYLSLGTRNVDFHKAIAKIGQQNQKEEDDIRFAFDRMRNAVFETELERLPDAWFGYNSVDLLILSTESRKFLTGLGQPNQTERLKAIAQWVRRGGRLVVPIARHNQDAIAALLQNELAWQPPIPVTPPRVPGNLQYERLPGVESWGGVNAKPFQRKDPQNPLVNLPIPIASLDPGNVVLGDWEVLAESGPDHRPLIAKVRYGLGQITYLAFSLEDTHFFAWEGKEKFLQTMVDKLAPRSMRDPNRPQNFNFGRNQEAPDDLATQLLGPAALDNFDVKVIPFGYVALFIVLYILVVGPLDFCLLKYVFKRLEWTWITFPSVVLAVSVIAYFAAYALKGRDMKINKIDIVDFDLRTSLDEARQPKNVHAYGQSFFTILSPRIQNYTIGMEPNQEFWGEKSGKVLNVDLMSWMGRPSDGMNAMGRGSSSGFFRNPYDFALDYSGLRGVPIPVWTTKAFSASWEQALPKPPFVADLVYYQKKGDERISGKLENHLGVDLIDAWLLYDKTCYPLEGGLKSVPLGAAPKPITIADRQNELEVAKWVNLEGEKDEVPDLRFNPTIQIKQLLFHEIFDIGNRGRNHLLRPLDLGWRIKKESLGKNDRSTREAILFARVRIGSGSAQSLTNDPKSPLPTKLWLGELPDVGKTVPTLVGNLNQCTYIRVILPVRPADE